MSEQALTVVSEMPPPENPGSMIRHATDVAGVCREIVMRTACQIQGRKYVKCEGWMAIATAHGCIASSRDVRKVDGGWTAIGEIRRMSDGVLLSQAEGFVGMDEKKWGNCPEYASRAMAQTRAISRACRAAFAHVVVLIDGGLSTTPAEEVPDGGFDREPPKTPQDAPGRFTQGRSVPNAPTPQKANSAPARTAPVPDAKTLMAAKAALEAHLVKAKTRFIADLDAGNNRDAALDYCKAAKIILTKDDLEDAEVRKLFPSVDWTRSIQENEANIIADRDRHIAGIDAMMRGDKIPDAPAVGKATQAAPEPEEPPTISEKPDLHGTKEVYGTVDNVNVKRGTGKGGPWVRSAVCIGKAWYSTFHQNIGATAVALKARMVHVWFHARAAGNDMVWIEEANVVNDPTEQDDLNYDTTP
jgi:hypothetical protein